MFDFFKGNLLTVLSSTISIAINLSILSQVFDTDKFSANLVVKLVLLLTLSSSAMSNGKFSADRVVFALSLKIGGPIILLKP